MGDVLAGSNAVWEFDSDAVRIRCTRGVLHSRLLQALHERRIPYEAVTGAEFGPGSRRGTFTMRLLPRTGADPLVEAAGCQLRESADPYRLVLPDDLETAAAAWADRIRSVSGPCDRAERFLVDPPAAPDSFKAYDGKVGFDRREVTFRWSYTGASTAKWRAGDQRFPLSGLAGVDWCSPEPRTGHLRLLPRRGPRSPENPKDDPTAVVLGLGYGPVHESLPFAATLLAAVRTRSWIACPGPVRPRTADPWAPAPGPVRSGALSSSTAFRSPPP